MTKALTLPIPVRLPHREPVAVGSEATSSRDVRRLGLRKSFPFARLSGVFLLLAIWTAGSALGVIDERKLSAPWTVIATTIELISNGVLQQHVLASLTRAVTGFAIGVVIGTVLAVAAGLTRVGDALIDGPIQLKRAIPTLGLIPLLILWLGIGETFKITIIALGAIVTMYIQTHNSLTSIDNRYVELAEVLGLSRLTFIRKVVLPGALPGFFLGLRLSITGAWLTLIVVESINAITGLGKMMFNAQNYGQSDVILVGLFVYGVFGLTSDALLRIAERKALSWRKTLAG